MTLKVLDLFSGIGGFSLGLERTGGFETVAFCEIEKFPRKILTKHWPDVPCFEDVRKLKGDDVGPIDVITGGYPCQPFSTSGKREGEKDDRHLWPEVGRLLDEIRPPWFIGENVAGHISMGLDSVLFDLEAKGYTARTFIIPACAVDAKHRRDRVWIVAHSGHGARGYERSAASRQNAPRKRAADTSEIVRSSCQSHDVADTQSKTARRLPKRETKEFTRFKLCSKNVAHAKRGISKTQLPLAVGAIKSRMGGGLDGVPTWLDGDIDIVPRVITGALNRTKRLGVLGNAVHPLIPMIIGYAILEAESNSCTA